MTDHLSHHQVEAYRAGTLPPAALLAADDHLARCVDCRDRVASGVEPAAIASSLRAQLSAAHGEDHLDYEQLEAFVDGTAAVAVQEAVRGHVESCEDCAAELRTLREFAAEVRGDEPEVRVAAPVRTVRPRPSRIGPLLALAASLLLVALGAYLGNRRLGWGGLFVRDAPATSEVARVEPATTPSVATPLSGAAAADAEPRAEPVLTLADGGGVVTLDSAGTVGGLALDPDEHDLVSEALRSGRPFVDERVAGFLGTRGTLLGDTPDEPTFDLREPLATAVRDDVPTFRWSAVDGADHYRVEVFDAGFALAASSGPISVTHWTPGLPLARGREYSWHVVASVGGSEVRSPIPPAPEARFFVLDRETASAVDRDAARHADSHLLRGLLFARAGLLSEAEAELRELEQENPRSDVARELLSNLRRQ
jgi:hypothetical protein